MFGNILFSTAMLNIQAVLVANGIGVCLMSAILFHPHRRTWVTFLDGKLFYWMCRICFALCICETACFLLDGQQFPGARELLILSNSALFLLAAALSCVWLFYMNYKLFESPARLKKMLPAAIPAAAAAVLAVANFFTSIYFGLSDSNEYYRTPLFAVFSAVIYLYLTAGAAMAYRRRSQAGKYVYLPAISFLIPIYIGSLIQVLCYGVALIWVSVAIGLTFLYINLQNRETFLDSVTGLYNRNFLTHYMHQIKKGTEITGVLLDINDFKLINDTCGHLEGDRVLRDVGEMLVRCAGDNAVVIRYGGDEFVVLLESGEEAGLRKMQEELDAFLLRYNEADSFPVPISLSGGVARLDTDHVEQFFREMDRNMYREKRVFYERKREYIGRDDAGREAGVSRKDDHDS